MSDHDELSKRPDRVIILDAEDPMTEVHGRFVWQDEHERVVDEVRRQAFAEGYQAGARDQGPASVRVDVRPARTMSQRVGILVLVLLALLVLLMLPIVLF